MLNDQTRQILEDLYLSPSKDTPDTGRSVSVAVQTEQSGWHPAIVQRSQSENTGLETFRRRRVSTVSVCLHPTQASSKEIQKTESDSSEHQRCLPHGLDRYAEICRV